jgi:hypothetical protein
VRLLAVALLLLVALPGCILQKGQDDLSYVCEKHVGAAGPAYAVDGLVLHTQVLDANLTAEHARRILGAVQLHVITLAQHAHANFTATLAAADAGWRFEGVGRATNGSVLDTYALDVTEDQGAVTVAPLRPVVGPVLAPESVVAHAWTVVNATPELDGAKTRTPTLVASGWDPIIPTCVRLLFQDGPADAILPASPEHPHTVVVVSLASDRVVFLQRQGWTAQEIVD